MTERKLARVVLIDELLPIEGADRIELALIGGWQVIVQKGLYTPGSKAVYFEVDSLLNTGMSVFESLAKLSSKLLHNIDGVTYARIKTMKMKGVISQGFCVPLSEASVGSDTAVDYDLTEYLGVIKYESVAESSLNNAGGVVGKTGASALGFPKFIPKTDQTRVQNITALYDKSVASGELFEKTFKLDGSSLTAFVKDGVLGVCSRNVGFRLEDENKPLLQALKDFIGQWKQRGFARARWEPVVKKDDNAFTQLAVEAGLIQALSLDGRNLAIQGEMVGPSIQKNFEGVAANEFYCYDVYLIDEQRYMLPFERHEFCREHFITQVPMHTDGWVTLPQTVALAIEDADGPSGLNGKYREGFVYKATDRDFSFKVISNKYLLKEE